MLGQVRLQLEVGFEFAGAELALVGVVYHNYLFGLGLLLLGGLRLDEGLLAAHGLPPPAALQVGARRAVLALPRSIWNHMTPVEERAAPGCLNRAGGTLVPA